jgi:hypothetical protein
MTSRAIRRAYAIHRYQTVVDNQIVQAAEPLTKGGSMTAAKGNAQYADKPDTSCGNAAASTAAPHPPRTNHAVPINSAVTSEASHYPPHTLAITVLVRAASPLQLLAPTEPN